MLKAGVARAVINPPLNLPHAGWGAQSHIYPQGIEADLWVTALVLADGSQSAVILELDLCRLLPDQVEAIRTGVHEAAGIEASHVTAVVTHNHSGPLTTRDYSPSGKPVRLQYMEYVREQAIAAVLAAQASLEPVTVAAAAGTCRIGRNRRQRLDDGQTITGYNAHGETDPTVSVLGLTRESGETLASLVQYACHPTTLGYLNDRVSPDYPGVMKRTVEELAGGICLFLQGAAGDIGPGPEGFKDNIAAMKRIGTTLGSEAAKLILLAKYEEPAFGGDVEAIGDNRELRKSDDVSLRVVSRLIRLPLQAQLPIPEAESVYAACRLDLEQLQQVSDSEAIRQAGFRAKRASLALERSKQFYGRAETEIEVHVICMGDTAIVGVPLEPFAELGIQIRKRSPFAFTMFGGYSNGWFGYLPTNSAFAEGGYEVETSPFAPQAAESLIDDVVRILIELKEEIISRKRGS